MEDARTTAGGRLLTEISNALVALHKEQFGRGPTRARTHFAGPDTMICILDEVLLPAERSLVELGEQQRVREARLFMQVASRSRFIEVIEGLVGRKVHSFVSASDPDRDHVFEIFLFETE